jgi:hypothetical protein
MEGYIDDSNKFVADIDVLTYDVDVNQKLKPTAFMNMVQEIAYSAADAMSFGYNVLNPKGIAWVLSRVCFKILRTPSWREKLQLVTWHKGTSGPFYLRDIELKDKNGNVLISCTTSWVILNLNERKLVVGNDILKLIPASSLCLDNAIDTPADRIKMPKDIDSELIISNKVGYSDVDFLKHTNNVRYLDWAMNVLDYDFASTHSLNEVTINFNHEVRPGENVDIYRSIKNDSYYIEGMVRGVNSFTARLDF